MQNRFALLALSVALGWQPLAGCVSEAVDDAGGGAGDGGASEGGAPVCEPEWEALAADEVVTLTVARWPGPLLMSREGEAGDIGYVSLDEDGTVRALTLGYDFVFSDVAVWEADEGGVLVSEGERTLDWPLALSAGLTAVSLERVDDTHIAAHLTAASGDGDEVWVTGALCNDCTDGPAYACAFDFDAYWQVVVDDE